MVNERYSDLHRVVRESEAELAAHRVHREADEATALPPGFNAIAVVIVMLVAIASYFFPWGFAPSI